MAEEKNTFEKNKENFKKDKIYNVTDLVSATIKDLTFFHSKNYSFLASKTKASYCVTLDSLSHFLPNSCKKIIVKNIKYLNIPFYFVIFRSQHLSRIVYLQQSLLRHSYYKH